MHFDLINDSLLHFNDNFRGSLPFFFISFNHHVHPSSLLSAESVSLFFSQATSPPDWYCCYIYSPSLWHLQTLPLHRGISAQLVYFFFTLRENLGIQSKLQNCTILSLLTQFLNKKLKDIFITCVETLKYLLLISKVSHYLLAWSLSLPLAFLLCLSLTLSISESSAWLLGSFSCYKVLLASWIMSVQMILKSIPSILFSHLSSSCVVWNSSRTFTLSCSIFFLQMNTCQTKLILLPSTLGSACQIPFLHQ